MPKVRVPALWAGLSVALLLGSGACGGDAPKPTWQNPPEIFNPKSDKSFAASINWKFQSFNETRKAEKPAVLLVYNSNTVEKNPQFKLARDTFVSWQTDASRRLGGWEPHGSLSRGLAELAFDPAADGEFCKSFEWQTRDVNEVRGAGKPAVLLVYDTNTLANNPALANIRNVFQGKNKDGNWEGNWELRKGLADLFRPNPLPKDWFLKKETEENWVKEWRPSEHLQFVLVDANDDKWPPEVANRGRNGAEVMVFTCYGRPYGMARPLGRQPAPNLMNSLVQMVKQAVAQNPAFLQMYAKDAGREWTRAEGPEPDPKAPPIAGEQDWAKGWRGMASIPFVLVDAAETKWPPSITAQAGGGAAVLVFSCDTSWQRVEPGRPADLLEKLKQALKRNSRAVAQYRAGKTPPEWVPPEAVAATKPPVGTDTPKTEPDLTKTLLNGLDKEPKTAGGPPLDNQPKGNQPPASNKPRKESD